MMIQRAPALEATIEDYEVKKRASIAAAYRKTQEAANPIHSKSITEGAGVSSDGAGDVEMNPMYKHSADDHL